MEPVTTTICALGAGAVSCLLGKVPESVVGNLALGVVAGMIANPSDRTLCKGIKAVSERLRNSQGQHDMPINHDLQRAVRRAYLEATCFVTETCKEKEFKVPLNPLKRNLTDVFFPREEIRQLDNILESIGEELKELPKAKYTPPDSAAIQEIELLLQPKNITPQEQLSEFRTALKNGVIAELSEKHGEIPEPLIQMIQEGHQENQDWFDVMCAFFNAILKNDTIVSTVIQTQLLARLTAQNIPITLESFQNEFEKLAGETLKIKKITIRIGLIVQDIRKDMKQVRKDTKEIKETGYRTEQKIDHITKVVENRAWDEEEPEFHLPEDRNCIPPVCGNLPKRHLMRYKSMGNAFVGRVADLWQIYDLLQKGETAVVQGVGVVIGMGGLGKTQLAIEFVQRFGPAYPGGVFWIEAEQGIPNMIAKIADAAEIQIDGRLETEAQMSILWKKLNTFKPVLIVLDNFPESDLLNSWLPPMNNIHVVVTTRRRDMFKYPKISLDVLSSEEGTALLNSGEREFEKEDAEKLVQALGGLPLALELAKFFLNVRTSLSVENLLDEIQKKGEMKTLDIFAQKYADQLPSGHVKEVAATIQLSWDLASDTAKQVLQAMSLLAPEPVPKRLLREILEMPEEGGLSDPLDEAIDELDKKLSLIMDVDEAGDPRIHRLVAGFVREMIAEGDELYEKVAEVVEEEMSRVEDDKDTAAYWELDKVVPHAERLLDTDFIETEQAIDISGRIGWYYENHGIYSMGEKFRRDALNLAESHFESGHKIIARSQSNLGLVLKDLGKLPEAEQQLRDALESYKNLLGADHPHIATVQSNLGLVLQDLGKLPDKKENNPIHDAAH